MFKNGWLTSFYIFALLAVSACEEKKAAVLETSEKKEPLTAAQDSATRRQYMFDKSAKAELLPAELIPFIYNPYVAYEFEEADLNRDGLKDYILVLAKAYAKDENGEDDLASVPEDSPAPVLIILRLKDKTLQFHSKNEVVFNQYYLMERQRTEGGIYADSLGNGFHFSNHSQGAGATATYTDVDYHFVLDKKSNKFYLAEEREESDMVSPEGAKEFMRAKARTPGYSYDTTAWVEEDYEPDITIKKYKPGEVLFNDFKYLDYYNEEQPE